MRWNNSKSPSLGNLKRKTLSGDDNRDPEGHAQVNRINGSRKMLTIEGTLNIVVQGIQRVEKIGVTMERPYIHLRLRALPDLVLNGPENENAS